MVSPFFFVAAFSSHTLPSAPKKIHAYLIWFLLEVSLRDRHWATVSFSAAGNKKTISFVRWSSGSSHRDPATHEGLFALALETNNPDNRSYGSMLLSAQGT